MSRLSALAAHPRRTLSALAVVLAAAGITAGSGANFTSHSANPANAFSTGTLSIGNSQSSAILTASGIKPGQSASGTVDIENTGSLTGAFTLSTSNPSDSSPSILGQLDLRIEDCGAYSGTTAPVCGSGTVIHNGKVNAVGSVTLGNFAASAKHRYKFDVTLPSSTGNTYQGKSGSIEFDWDAVAV